MREMCAGPASRDRICSLVEGVAVRWFFTLTGVAILCSVGQAHHHHPGMPSACRYIYNFFWHLQNQILCMMSTLVWSDCVSSHCTLVDGMIRVIKSSPVLELRRLAGRPVLHFAVSLEVLVMSRVSFNHIPEQVRLHSCCWRTLNHLTASLVQIESFAWAGLKFLGFLSNFWGTKPKTTLLKRLKCRCKR